eukprot:765898-Hanusia_phi.AAC.7
MPPASQLSAASSTANVPLPAPTSSSSQLTVCWGMRSDLNIWLNRFMTATTSLSAQAGSSWSQPAVVFAGKSRVSNDCKACQQPSGSEGKQEEVSENESELVEGSWARAGERCRGSNSDLEELEKDAVRGDVGDVLANLLGSLADLSDGFSDLLLLPMSSACSG